MSLNSSNRTSNLTLILLFIIIKSNNLIKLTSCHQPNPLFNRTPNNNKLQNNNNYNIIAELHQPSHRISLNSENLILLGNNNNNIQTTTTLPAPPVEIPDFEEPIGNHTVALGRDAQLSCKINNLGNFRTAWLRVEDKGILTIHNNIITRNYRIGLINNDEGKNFILTIKNVQSSDKGGYMCQINSVPMKYAIGYLDVLTPPFFDDMPSPSTLTSSSQDGGSYVDKSLITTSQTPPGAGVITVIEGKNVTISCHANGHPIPLITWRREDNEQILLNGASPTLDGVSKIDGSSISLQTVSRLNSGAYLCIASNGVQPSASKRQVLDVQFSPVIRIPQTDIGANLNQKEAKLICFVELNPLGSYYWVKLNSQHTNYQRQTAGNEDDLWLIENEELLSSDKFEIVIKQVNSEKVQMILTIRNIERQDFAYYKCIAKNSLAIQSNSIRLYESSPFSLNNMFRGSPSQSPTLMGNDKMTSDQQNDQQQDNNNNNNRATNNRGSILSRAHTRSSWIQRGQSSSSFSNSNRQQEPSDALLDPSSSSSSSSSSAAAAASKPAIKINNLLFNFYYTYHIAVLLLINHFIIPHLASNAQLIVFSEGLTTNQ